MTFAACFDKRIFCPGPPFSRTKISGWYFFRLSATLCRLLEGDTMNRVLSFAVFILVVSVVYFLMHYFVFKTISKNISLAPKSIALLRYIFLFSGLSWPLGMALSRWLGFTYLNHYAFIWLGILSILFFFMAIAQIFNLIFPQKRILITGIVLVLAGVVSIYSLINNLGLPVVKTIPIHLKKLPLSISGFRMVQLSDLHLDSYKSGRRISRIVDRVNALNPDLIVITGDFIDGDITTDQLFCDSLKRLKASRGIIAITGNHEFYAGIKYFMRLCKKLGIEVLRNERRTIAGALEIVGIDDNEGRRFSGMGPDLDKALEGCDPGKPVVLLRHRPEDFNRAVERGVDLQISGHTHAGQIPPMDILVCTFLQYPYGLYEKKGSYIYTSCGTGYWGPPMRLFSRSEIVQFVLIADQ